MRILAFCLLLFAFSLKLSAQEINIIPKPVEVIPGEPKNDFILSNNISITTNDSLCNPSIAFLITFLKTNYGITLIKNNKPETITQNVINLMISEPPKGVPLQVIPDQYKLNVSNKYISIISRTDQGIFYGIQTLLQLLPPIKSPTLIIPSVLITDYPRFAYRGMHLDVSRHFFEVSFVKKYIDYLALHKMNYFHWHLTDDHGWRIEIKKYPKLTSIGAWRNGSIIGLYPGTGNDHIRYGGFYTQAQIREVIQYAAKRYITIIPEIEMPAHSMAVLAAYPEFGTEPNKKHEVAQTWGIFNKFNNVLQPTEKTFKFLEDVLTEVMALFPSQYIHIGGDEAAKIWWKQSTVAQQIIQKNNLKDEIELQSYFVQRIEKFVNSKGKTIIGWDEILDGGLAPNAVVMSWRGEKAGIAAAKEQHKVIMTPEAKLYLNHAPFLKEDSLTASKFLPIDRIYNYEPVPAELTFDESKFIWGAQGNLWTEYVTNPAKVEYMLFPRIDALSEILWSPKASKNYPDFLKRLKTQLKRYDLMGIKYSKKYLTN